MKGCVLWYLTPISTIFQLYYGEEFYWWRMPEYQEKTIDLPQVTAKTVSPKIISSTHRMSGIQILAVMGTDCTGNCKSNYHKITTTTTTAPILIKLLKLFAWGYISRVLTIFPFSSYLYHYNVY
jgi:hypothetical protein